MSEDAGDRQHQVTGRLRRRPRFHLLTLMLLVTAIAVWMAYWQIDRDTNRMRLALPGLRDAARLLRVDDPNQYAVVYKHPLWDDDVRWDVYLPSGTEYVLRLATQEVDERGLAIPVMESPIAAGRHAIEFRCAKVDDQWRIDVTVDGKKLLQHIQPAGWNAGRGSTGGSAFDDNAQQDVRSPLILFRRRWMVVRANGSSSTPTGPGDGILLWIEPKATATPAAGGL